MICGVLLLAILVSMETLASDVQHLRKGLDAAKSERDKQPDNYAIHVSFQKYDFFYAVATDFFASFMKLSHIYYLALAGTYVLII